MWGWGWWAGETGEWRCCFGGAGDSVSDGGDGEMERGDRQDLQKHVGVVAGDGIGMVRWGGEEECDEG